MRANPFEFPVVGPTSGDHGGPRIEVADEPSKGLDIVLSKGHLIEQGPATKFPQIPPIPMSLN